MAVQLEHYKRKVRDYKMCLPQVLYKQYTLEELKVT